MKWVWGRAAYGLIGHRGIATEWDWLLMSSKANLGFVKAALRFAPALLRTPAWRLSVVFLTVVVAAIMTLIISVTSMKLSPDQEREYSLGVADYTANMPDVPVRGYKKLDLDHLSTLGRVELITTMPVTGLGLAAEEHRELRVSETPWATSPYPKRYSLAEGRYPSAPGEIAISTALAAGGAVGGDVRIAVPGVDTSWKITGIIADKYLDDATIYAAPGTLSDVYPPHRRPDRHPPISRWEPVLVGAQPGTRIGAAQGA